MASNARKAFDEHVKDVKRLLKIHEDVGGDGPGRKHGVEVLNKSAIVLITAYWEAYCEDLAEEALDHLVAHLPDATKLPTELKKRLAKELKDDKNEIAVWGLADDGWKAKVKARLPALTKERNWSMNTPKSKPLCGMFDAAIGLTDVSTSWHWSKMSVDQATKKLDKYVALRGSIAHRGGDGVTCKKSQVQDYLGHVKRLASKTGGEVNRFVKTHTGKGLW